MIRRDIRQATRLVDHMAQSNALREQPSMDEILASIRRIIDAGEDQSKRSAPAVQAAPQPAPQASVPPPAANDAGDERPRAPQATLTQTPPTRRVAAEETKPEIAAAVSAYMERERPVAAAPAPTLVARVEQPSGDSAAATEMDSGISEIEAALHAEFGQADEVAPETGRRAKYEARFTEADDGVFRQVGSLLRGKVGEAEPRPVSTPAAPQAATLVSEAVSQSVSNSFSCLSDLLSEKQERSFDSMAEEMLRPMLQEWLDNNLPSLVERLVRSEIERIARGEPRTTR